MDKLPNIPGYAVKRMIGQGGMATVYLAEQVALHRLVALKIMSPALAADDTFTSRFLKEGATSANLFHPKIIKVFDSGVHDHHYFMAMEYLSGGTLKEKIGSGLPPKKALQILKDMADALRYAHSKDVVHRDIKSQNILLYEDGTPVLSDFGVAKALGSNTALTRTGIAVGSPGYMSPEQLRGQAIDGRTDIYALGILFYEMLTGELPYQATDQFAVAFKHIYDPIPQLPAEYSVFQPILDKALAKEPEDRLVNADALLEEIAQAEAQYTANISGETNVMQTDPSGRYARPEKNRKTFKAIAASLLIALLGVGGWFYYQKHTGITLSAESAQLYNIAIQQRDAGNYQASLDALSQALLIDPEAERLISLHREVLSRVTAQQRSLALADEFLAKARQAQEEGELQQSLDLVSRGLSHNSESTELRALQTSLEQALQRQREQLLALFDEAELLLQENEYTQGLAKLDAAQTLKPAGPELSRLQELQQELKAAQERAQKALELEQQLQAIQQEAQGLFDQGQWQDSLAKITQGLALSPNSAELLALKEKADARLAEQQNQQEQERLRQAQLDEYLQKARNAFDADDLQISLQIIEQGLSISAENNELLELQANVQSSIQQRQELSMQLLQAAQELHNAGNYQESLSKLEDALAIKPSEPVLSQIHNARNQLITEQNAAQQEETLQKQLRDIKNQALALREQGLLLQSLATLNEGLAIRSDASELSALHEQITRENTQLEQALTDARQAQGQGELDRSLAILDRGLEIVPTSRELLSLRDLIQASVELRRQAVARLIQEAEQLRVNEDYSASLAKINQALELNPSEPEGTQLQDLREQVIAKQNSADKLAEFLEQAQHAFDNAQYEQSLEFIAQGLELSPDHVDLKRLQTEVEQAHLAKIETQQATQVSAEQKQINELLKLAQRQIDDNRLTLPVDDNALQTYQRVFELDPDNEQAKKGLTVIADRYQSLAIARRDRQQYASSLRFIERGLSVVEGHASLLALRAEVSALQERQAKLDTERKEKERQAKLEAEREAREQRAEAARKEKERQAKLERTPPKQNPSIKIQPTSTKPPVAVKTPAPPPKPNNSQKIASLNSQLQKLQNDLAGVKQLRTSKNCDYWESTYGLNDMTTRQKGCPRYNSQIAQLQQEISQIKQQLASLN